MTYKTCPHAIGINLCPVCSPQDVSAAFSDEFLCDLRLVDYKDSPGARDCSKQQLPQFEIRAGNEVMSQGDSPIEVWKKCAELLHRRLLDA